MIELINKYPDKIEFEVDYIVYTYDNFKFYLKKENRRLGLEYGRFKRKRYEKYNS